MSLIVVTKKERENKQVNKIRNEIKVFTYREYYE